jgi:hypothetical protein
MGFAPSFLRGVFISIFFFINWVPSSPCHAAVIVRRVSWPRPRGGGTLARRWLDKDNAHQASNNKRTFPLTASPPNPLCLNQRLEACIAQVPLTPFVGYNCCPCCSNAFALLVVPVAPVHIYSFMLHPTPYTHPSTHCYLPATT